MNKSVMRLSKAYYSPQGRTIDDFADDIICRTTSGSGAVFDVGLIDEVSDPDFPGSLQSSAARVRAAVNEPNPRSCFNSYDMQYRYMRHWDRKEKFRDLGMDPNEVLKTCHQSFDEWPFKGDWLSRVKRARHAEFFFKLLVATAEKGIEEGVYQRSEVPGIIMSELGDEFPEIEQSMKLDNIPMPREEMFVRQAVEARLSEIFSDSAPSVSVEADQDEDSPEP